MEATPIYPRRNLWAAARDALVWLSGPVSERGASRAFRLTVHMGGRVLHERRLAARQLLSAQAKANEDDHYVIAGEKKGRHAPCSGGGELCGVP